MIFYFKLFFLSSLTVFETDLITGMNEADRGGVASLRRYVGGVSPSIREA